MNADNETTRRMPVDEKILRADARLKMMKAVDDLAAAIERLHITIQRAHTHDVAVIAADCPIPVRNSKLDIKTDVAIFARDTMLWAAHLHEPDRFERLGTRRFEG